MLLTTLHGRSCTGNSHSWLIRTIQARASEHHRQVAPPRTLSRLRRKDILTQVINQMDLENTRQITAGQSMISEKLEEHTHGAEDRLAARDWGRRQELHQYTTMSVMPGWQELEKAAGLIASADKIQSVGLERRLSSSESLPCNPQGLKFRSQHH